MNKANAGYKYPKMTLKQNSDNCKPRNRSLHKKQSGFRTIWLAEIICTTYTSANQKYNPNRVFPRLAAATFFCCKLWFVYLFICRIFLRCHWSVLISKLGTALLQVDETANSYPVYRSPDKFLNDKNLQGSAFCLHGTRGTVQGFQPQTSLQSAGEFARFRVNGLQRWKLRPLDCSEWHKVAIVAPLLTL